MGAGLPSYIKYEDFNVLPLSSADFISTEEESAHTKQDDPNQIILLQSHFYHLVELSVILADILDAFFTIRAVGRTSSNLSLSLELAKPFRARLKDWKANYDSRPQPPQSSSSRHSANLDGNAALELAYPVATMILFRALLRPIGYPNASWDDSVREAVRAGARACCIEVVEFVENLKRGVGDAFWHSCTFPLLPSSIASNICSSLPSQSCNCFLLYGPRTIHLHLTH